MREYPPKLLEQIHWLGHDSFRIEGPIIIYLDPWRLSADLPKADLVLISHEHHDHCSPEDIAKVRKAETLIAAPSSAASKIDPPVTALQVGDLIKHKGVTVEAVPAYNCDKPFHPKAAGHLGFVLTLGKERLYFAGDTDHIPEMADVDCDVALLPVSGTYVMTAEEAAQAAAVIQPSVAIPMHYGAGVVGTEKDAENFRDLCEIAVQILPLETG
jgi:L-ascorbate metabolism protein UlaG (beta-lactamase superfamily)